jgi:heme/copper-type cytochrome/quinol oxidase subunit 1
MRAPGMSLDRTPVFSWSMLVAAGAWLLSLPVFVANAALVYVDTHNSGVVVGDGATAWSHIAWVLLLPQVYVCAIPALGVLGDVIVTGSGRRQVSRGVLFTGIGAFGALAIGGWAQFAQPDDLWTNPLFVGVAVLAILPLLACLAVWATGLRGGATLSGALVLAVVSLLVLLLATVTGALFAIEQLRVQDVVDEAYGLPVGAVGQANLVLAAAIAGGLAGLFHWGPKITGRLLADGMAKLAAPVVLLGALLWGLVPFIEGLQGRFSALEDATDALGVVSVAGAALMVLAVAIGLVALIGATRGPTAEGDPWGGQTLEWATSSPPPPGNFATLAVVRSPEPLLDPTEPTDEEAS